MRGSRAFACIVNGQLRFARYARGTGARRIKLPLPAVRRSTEPENGSPVSVYFESAALTVPPISKQRPVQLRLALLPPAAIALHLIFRVEAVAADQAFAKAKRHAGVIGPLAGLQVERAAALHVSEWPERAGRLEFQCGAETSPAANPSSAPR